jgi:hypothetical protein
MKGCEQCLSNRKFVQQCAAPACEFEQVGMSKIAHNYETQLKKFGKDGLRARGPIPAGWDRMLSAQPRASSHHTILPFMSSLGDTPENKTTSTQKK